jgi:two-component system phosphate regulon sensor histidine kinase PhoR
MSPLISRLCILLLCLSAGTLAARSFTGSAAGLWLGACAGVICWFLPDYRAVSRTLRWLQRLQEDPQLDPPSLRGIWLEIVDRIRRPLRQQIRLRQDSENNLKNLQSALQVSPNGAIALDEKNRIEWCNQTACQHLGLDAHRDIAQPITHLLRDPVFSDYLSQGDFSSPVTLDSPLSTPAHTLKLSVQIHPYGQGRHLMLSCDITVQEHAEAMRRDFIANVSHEIRTPLTVLAGFVEILQSGPRSEDERQHYLTMMERQSRRMQNLVDDLLALSRLEDSPPPDFAEWTPVHSLLAHCEADARALSETLTPKTETPQQIIFPAVPEFAALAGAGKELFSAFSNLISNAVRYTPPGGRIEICWTPLPTGGVAFSVHDSGPGIPAEHLPRLTERFYRADRSRSHETGGTGLGLSIVKHVLMRHHAVLRIESVFGHGATFTAAFPARCYRSMAPSISADVAQPDEKPKH